MQVDVLDLGFTDKIEGPFRRAACDDGFGFRSLRRDNGGDAGFQDARFLCGDLLEAAAEESFVVEIDWSDHAQRRPDDIGCIEAAAESDLDNR